MKITKFQVVKINMIHLEILIKFLEQNLNYKKKINKYQQKEKNAIKYMNLCYSVDKLMEEYMFK